ncbi:MmcQ/YjbR family DNA-binding protein [Paradevosia shaoguanensis]|jgi:hypothetical protein|uniref:MmcQ/YjbR family DNA-binding protein n=1 Tax=Paradevosia shaoguanensis TaxID=1335043 RepID=UPI000508A33D|nr:hypothetical protein JP74_01410 [Devosia sp. 17-2-E-8]MBI4048202.1 MmcQ/YjbR family DNA-binding protein [Devosia nanyangense]QMV01672.1 hypothetical protein GHV40_09345 [Devosia sp. D6-9]
MTASNENLDLSRVTRLAREAGLPEVSEGLNYGTPALKVKDKTFARLKDATTLVLLLPMEQKEMLLEFAPHVYFETDHYKGWPAVLARLDVISDEELRDRLVDAWRAKAPKRVAEGFGRGAETG